MALAVKGAVVVQYGGYPHLWHARYLLAHVVAQAYVILTPDSDMYTENLADGSAEIAAWRPRPPGGALPFGIVAGRIYDFKPHPTDGQLTAFCAEGEVEATAERVARGLPEPVRVVPGVVGAVGAAVVAADPGGAPGLGGPGGAGGVAVGGPPPVPPPGVAVAPAAGAVGAPAPAVGPGGAALVAPGGVALPGVGGLAAALGIGVPAAGGGGTAVGAHGTAAPPVLPIATASDLRTLAIRYDSTGRRHREFREAVELMDGSETAFSDFAVTAPRTVSWCARFMVEQGGSPRAWHQR